MCSSFEASPTLDSTVDLQRSLPPQIILWFSFVLAVIPCSNSFSSEDLSQHITYMLSTALNINCPLPPLLNGTWARYFPHLTCGNSGYRSKQLSFGELFLCPFPSHFWGPNSWIMFGIANTRVVFHHPHWPAADFFKYRGSFQDVWVRLPCWR